MTALGPALEPQGIEPFGNDRRPPRFWTIPDRALSAIYTLALVVSISTWFIAFRAPLRLDETGSYWQISAGFSEIWARRYLLFPAYPYILWFSTKIIGTSEIALRVPSIIAMFGAVYLLYLGARELFERDIAFIAAIVFCLDPIVLFTSIDVRPYAFGVLATNAAILVLLRLRRRSSVWLAALFGISSALIVWFHILLGVVLPALMLSFIVLTFRDRKIFWKQLGVVLAAFAVTFLPVIPGLIDMFRTSKTHTYEPAPTVAELLQTLIPGRPFAIVCCIGFVAFLVYAARTKRASSSRFEIGHLMLCVSLALIPALIQFGVSRGTSAHTFTYYHRLSAVPGIALCWAFGIGCFRSRNLRLLICVALAVSTAFLCLTAPFSRLHQYSLKYAIELIEKNASVDDAPVVMCSGFAESNFVAMPSMEAVKNSRYFAPLSYYQLSVPVIPLPQILNNPAIQIGSQFLQTAARKHERFLVTGDAVYSAGTLAWFTENAAATHIVHNLGVFDGMEVLEFVPREH